MKTFHNYVVKTAAVVAMIAALGSGAAFAADMLTITHAQGTTEVPHNPKKVITFDLATLDTLDALGVDVFGVPGFNMPTNLDKYEGDAYGKFGSLFEPDFEAVNAAQPDLIIVSGRSSGAYAELSKIAPTIDLTDDWTNFIPSVKANSEILGQIFDKSAEVAALEADLDAAVDAVKAKAADLGRVFVVMTNGGKVTAFGPGTRFGLVYDAMGMTPAIEDVEAATHGEAISNELILETNPDWLIVLDRDAAIGTEGGASAAETLNNELVAATNAAKNGHILYVDTARWYITNGGLTNMTAIINELKAAMIDG